MIINLESTVSLPAYFKLVLLVVLICSVSGAIRTIAKEARKYLCQRTEMDLNREMVGHGVEPREIEQVMHANLDNAKKKSN